MHCRPQKPATATVQIKSPNVMRHQLTESMAACATPWPFLPHEADSASAGMPFHAGHDLMSQQSQTVHEMAHMHQHIASF